MTRSPRSDIQTYASDPCLAKRASFNNKNLDPKKRRTLEGGFEVVQIMKLLLLQVRIESLEKVRVSWGEVWRIRRASANLYA